MPKPQPPNDDGLITPEVGDWSGDKHHFLWRYLNAFTTAMRGKKWKGLHYIDLFSGAGIERLKTSQRLGWGSPLLAAQAKHPFTRLHLCEKKPGKCNVLAQRLQKFPQPSEPLVLCGDANAKVDEIVGPIPPRALCLAFLDPYGFHLDFETVRALSLRRMDLIIFFPDHVDALRNWNFNYAKPGSSLDRFMGSGADWLGALQRSPQTKLAEVLREVYISRLKTLGYKHFEYERISRPGHPLYLLIFCSNHPAGGKIWRGISSIKPDAQRTFDFGAGGP